MDHQQEQRNGRNGAGYDNRPRGRGRTFYGRHANPGFSVNSGGHRTGLPVTSNANNESSDESSRQELHVNGGDRSAGSKYNYNKWNKRNGYYRNDNSRGNRSHMYKFYQEPSKISSTVKDDDNSEELWLPETPAPMLSATPTAAPTNPSSSHVVPLSPDISEEKNIWKERLEFYHSAQPKDAEEENLMMKRAIEESQQLEADRQRRILEDTASHFHSWSLSDAEDLQYPDLIATEAKSVADDSTVLASSSSSSISALPSVASSSSMVTSLPVNSLPCNSLPTLSSEDIKPDAADANSSVAESCASPEELFEDKLLIASCTSNECRSPSGLVAFSQSATSAFTSVVPSKHANLPVVVADCDQRIRESSSKQNSQSSAGGCSVLSSHNIAPAGDPSPDYSHGGSIANSSECSHYTDEDCHESHGSEEPAPSFSKSSSVDAYNHDSNVSSPSVLDEKQLPECAGDALPLDGTVAPLSCIQVAVPAFPQYYHSPVPGMICPFPQPMPPYINSMQPCYPSGIIPSYPYPHPQYSLMPPPGMVSPGQMGMVPMMCPTPAMQRPAVPYWYPPHIMYHPMSMPLSVQNEPSQSS